MLYIIQVHQVRLAYSTTQASHVMSNTTKCLETTQPLYLTSELWEEPWQLAQPFKQQATSCNNCEFDSASPMDQIHDRAHLAVWSINLHASLQSGVLTRIAVGWNQNTCHLWQDKSGHLLTVLKLSETPTSNQSRAMAEWKAEANDTKPNCLNVMSNTTNCLEVTQSLCLTSELREKPWELA